MTDYDYFLQQKGYDPDADQLHDFVERIGKIINDGVSEDDARKQAIEG